MEGVASNYFKLLTLVVLLFIIAPVPQTLATGEGVVFIEKMQLTGRKALACTPYRSPCSKNCCAGFCVNILGEPVCG